MYTNRPRLSHSLYTANSHVIHNLWILWPASEAIIDGNNGILSFQSPAFSENGRTVGFRHELGGSASAVPYLAGISRLPHTP